jgi:ketosteroid isomerase-like protein
VSRENVEVVQRFVDHWNESGEPPWPEIDPDAVWVIDPSSFVAGTYRGHVVQSGATGAQYGALLFEIRAARIVAYRSYLSREDALRAAGLEK